MAAQNQQLQKPATTAALTNLSQLLERYKANIAVALPKHLTPDRMIRVALSAVSQSPKLLQCNPYTICGAIVQASILGLEPNSALGDCYLVPFWNSKGNQGKGGLEAQLVIGYQGKIKLVANTGLLKIVKANVVRQNDVFEFDDGLSPHILHRYHHIPDRGPVIGFWAGAELSNGARSISFMTVREAQEHRDKFALAKDKDKKIFGPWIDHFEAMALKTCIHKACKYLPKSVQAQTAWNLDEQHEAGIPQKFSFDIPLELQPTPDDDLAGQIEGSTVQQPQRTSEQQQPSTTTNTTPPATGEQGSLLPDAKRPTDPDDKAKGKR